MVVGGGYLSLLGLTRILRGGVSRRGWIGDYPPPGHIQDAYSRIDRERAQYRMNVPPNRYSDFGSPVNLGGVVDRGRRRMDSSRTGLNLQPTAGMVQETHRGRIGHTMMGATRSRSHLRKLYQIG